ncbi:MAG: zinc-ribbon domain-containing protein [Eubacterium sp.]|nr:zinc-ribbon domain-containing protein [Eubacterium sp.]MCM1305142.1 zinc-ribbon domain-containing protein [Butyrivibrio sp.]MCM1344379.1 zinc-ribbon domain-containing protein [Muribaculaceae bacterium]MCM1411735.1 zinc-ribbon domain-containing protein [Lachnospiraceae bacterium]
MIKCPKCGKELEDGARFCGECGTPIPEQPRQDVRAAAEEPVQAGPGEYVFCPECGKKLPAGSLFCDNCGTGLAAVSKEQSATFAGQPVGGRAAGKKKKWPVFGIVAACAVVILIACAGIFAASRKSSGSKDDCAVYVKDRELFFAGLKSKDPLQVTEHFVKESDMDNADLSMEWAYVSYDTTISDDGKYLFFPDRMIGRGSWSIYYISLSRPDEEAVKIDSDIDQYVVNDSATYVTYVKSGDKLYSYDLKKGDKKSIAGDVEGFAASDDGRQVYYIDDEGTLYLWTMGRDSEEIDSGVQMVYHISDDFKTIYYTKKDALYRNGSDGKREKIASDVDQVIKVYGSGGIYYLKEMDVTAERFFADDMKVGDKELTESERDALLQVCEWAISDMRIGMLCYHDGRKETEIGVASIHTCAAASDAEAVLFALLDLDKFDRLEISQIVASADREMSEVRLSKWLTEQFEEGACELVLAQKGEMIPLGVGLEDLGPRFEIDPDGSRILYLDDFDSETDEGNLYLITVKDGKLSDTELLESGMPSYHFSLFTGWPPAYGFVGGSPIYYTDVEGSRGDLYVDGQFAASDVLVGSYKSESGACCLYTDYDMGKQRGTLRCYMDGKVVKIADDVYDYYAIGDEKILILSDYSLSRYEGELSLYDKGELRSIDDDVVCILRPSDTRLESIYYWYGW